MSQGNTTFLRRLKGCKYILTFDIYKAYDNVDLDTLDNLMDYYCSDLDVLAEWKNQLMDMKMLNMSISGQMLYRTKGVPQGSELAPFLFNFFTTCILYAIDSLGISSKILIYADNWILINNDKKIIENEYKIIKKH